MSVEDDDDPVEDVLARAADRAARYRRRPPHLRTRDLAFAEASVLYPQDMGEWQSAVYLLSGHQLIWGQLGARIMSDRTLAAVIAELEHPTRPWSSSAATVLRWAAHFSDVERWPAKFPYVFEQAYFAR